MIMIMLAMDIKMRFQRFGDFVLIFIAINDSNERKEFEIFIKWFLIYLGRSSIDSSDVGRNRQKFAQNDHSETLLTLKHYFQFFNTVSFSSNCKN